MRRFLIALALLSATVAFAQTLHCPEHGYASCRDTFEMRQAADGHMMHKWTCTCGDSFWVRT